MKPLVCAAVFACLLTSVSGLALAAGSDDNCFKLEDNKRLPFRVVQQLPPPEMGKDGEMPASALQYPATDFLTGQLDRTDGPESVDARTKISFNNNYMVWGNRCVNLGVEGDWCLNTSVPQRKGNWYSGGMLFIPFVRHDGDEAKPYQVRPIYSSYRKANTCTAIQLGNAFGDTKAAMQAKADRNGLELYYRHDGDLAELATPYDATTHTGYVKVHTFPDGDRRPYFINLCIVEARNAKPPKMVMIDYEPWDARPALLTQNFIARLAKMAHDRGGQFGVFTDFLTNEAGQENTASKRNGIVAGNIASIVNSVDVFSSIISSGATPPTQDWQELPASPRLWSPVTFLKTELAYLAANGVNTAALAKKIVPAISLFDLRIGGPEGDEPAQMNAVVASSHIGGMMLQRGGAKLGGSCSSGPNQIIHRLMFGTGT